MYTVRSSRSRCTGRNRRLVMLLVKSVVLAGPSLSLAGIVFGSGSTTWSWNADTNSNLGGKTTFVITPPSAGSINTNPFQLDRIGSSGGAQAIGKGSIGHVTNSTTATFSFRSGTGSAQNDPSNVFTGETVTKVQYSGLFDVTTGGFGPTASGYFSLTVGGTAGAGGYTRVVGDLVFRRNSAGGPNLRSPISFNDQFNGPTNFSKTYTYSAPFNPISLPAGDKVFVSGSLTFITSNGGSPSDMFPLQFEAGGAPPTATFFGGGGDWSDPLTWTAPPGSFTEINANIPSVPDGVGTRARFIDLGAGTQSVAITNDVTVGAFHSDGDAPLLVLSQGGSLRFDHSNGDASMYVSNPAGLGGVVFNAPVQLVDSLDMLVRGEPVSSLTTKEAIDLVFNAPISLAAPNATSMFIRGPGGVTLNAANSHGGQIFVRDGAKLNANAPGSLGNGPARAEGGMLILSNNQAQTNPAAGLFSSDGGQIDLNVPSVGAMQFDVRSGGIISGSSAELSQLVIGGNLQISPGAVIAHETFDVGPAGNPQNLPLEPSLIFGIANDFTANSAGSITIGTGSGGPWVGFGADRLIRRFGDDPTTITGQPTVIVAGAASLYAAGRLVMNGPLASALPGSELAIVGRDGTVELANLLNPFNGSMLVRDDATLRVNGLLPAVQNLIVESGGTLGGSGGIGGNVEVQTGGILEPGDERLPDDRRVGTLTVTNLIFSPGSILNFQFGGDGGSNDLLNVQGDLVLDGELVINQLQFFDTKDIYPIILFSGNLTNNGLDISPFSQEIEGLPAVQAASILITQNPGGGGTVFLVIPEPGVAGVVGLISAQLGLRRRRR